MISTIASRVQQRSRCWATPASVPFETPGRGGRDGSCCLRHLPLR
jgi:hypothetical protein